MLGSNEFTWEVEPPTRKATLGAARPKGALRICSEVGGKETISVPAALARRLASRKKSGKLNPSSRAELLYEVKVLAATVAWERLTGLLNRRDYSSKEAADKLRLDGFSAAVVEQSVQRAVAVGLINDARFADVFIRSKVSAGWGARRIEQELRRRGVDASALPGWPFEYLDPDGEHDRALEVARRKTVSGKNPMQKMARFLVSRGYSTSVALDVAREVTAERMSDEEG